MSVLVRVLIENAFYEGLAIDHRYISSRGEDECIAELVEGLDAAVAEIEAAAVERFVKERFWNSSCEVSVCVAESGMQWAANRRKEASK